ncbi:BCCT family transporter [Arthrobacter sp. JCM 19049]|uniref:BCCT family transporter n=1 Tax=Arthrobacter sp. JCM 19049 TaxID=1460643 RepID=UPI000B2BF1DF
MRGGNEAFGEVAMNTPEQAFYSLLEQYPGAPITAAIATFTGLLFYVTSADSGALVMANFTSHLADPQSDGSKPVRLFWSLATGLLTLGMLLVGGVPTLQGATVIMGLPFSFVLVFIMLGVFKSLRVESALANSYKHTMHKLLSSRIGTPNDRRSWKQRLARTMNYPGTGPPNATWTMWPCRPWRRSARSSPPAVRKWHWISNGWSTWSWIRWTWWSATGTNGPSSTRSTRWPCRCPATPGFRPATISTTASRSSPRKAATATT